MKKLSSIADILSGYTFREAIEPHQEGVIHVIQPRNLGALFETPLIEVFPKYERYLLRNNDILLTIKGGVNTVALLKIDDKTSYVCNAAFAVIRPNNAIIHPSYLAWYLQHDTTQQILRSMQTGTTVQNLALKDLQNLVIPILPMAEQYAIGRLALLETERARIIQELVTKRKILLDQDLITIVEKGARV